MGEKKCFNYIDEIYFREWNEIKSWIKYTLYMLFNFKKTSNRWFYFLKKYILFLLDADVPDLLPCGYIVGDNMHIKIVLKGMFKSSNY